MTVSYMTDKLIQGGYYSTVTWRVCADQGWGNPHMKHFWFGAFLVFLALLGVYSWFSIAPVDLHTRIEHYILAPLLIVYALVMLLLLWARLYDR
jgi:hypothetical protein